MEKQPTRLVVGLGNPGRRYARNRHNVGFQVVQRLAERAGVKLGKHPGRALAAQTRFDAIPVVLAEPQTFMNLSGQSVVALTNWYHIEVSENLLIVYDDLDLNLGQLRLRPGGSSGGHKGMESVIEHLKTQDFARLRVGIGRPEFGEPFRYVLEDFTAAEFQVMTKALDRAADAVECFLREGIVAAMNEYNRE